MAGVFFVMWRMPGSRGAGDAIVRASLVDR